MLMFLDIFDLAAHKIYTDHTMFCVDENLETVDQVQYIQDAYTVMASCLATADV